VPAPRPPPPGPGPAASTPPAVTARLRDDTAPGGTTHNDRITSDPAVAGTVTASGAVTSLFAGFDTTRPADFVDVTAALQPRGAFALDRARLDRVDGGTLPDGAHTLHLRATDANGNSGTFDLPFTLDTQAPGVTITGPDPTLTNQNITVTGHVTDTADALAQVVARVDGGTPAPVTVDGQGNVRLTTNFPLGDPSADGAHTVAFQATDQAGNVSPWVPFHYTLDTAALSVDFQLGPSANLLPQTAGHTRQSTVTLVGTATPSTRVTLQQTGQTTTADAAGAFSFNGVALVPGENAFTVTATDAFGKAATAQHTFTRDTNTLAEGSTFTTSFRLPFTVPQQAAELQFGFDSLQFGSPGHFMPDAFEAALVDASGNPLVLPMAGAHDAFFNQTDGQPAALGANTQQSGNTVSLDLAHLTAGTQATLVVRLVNNDPDTGPASTSVRLDDIEVLAASLNTPAGATLAPLARATGPAPDFTALSDVTASVQAAYGQTSFKEGGTVLFTDLALTNAGTYGVAGPLLATIDHLSDPTVRVLHADGTTPQGLPYIDFTSALPGPTLVPGQATTSRRLEFYNPNRVRFTYGLAVLAQLNRPPAFTSQPNTEAIPGVPYVYQATAIDPDRGETLTYSLVTGPAGMAVDPATGKVTWSPRAADLGTHAVALRVDDGRGASAEQDYTVNAIAAPPNRPPVFTSTPVVDGNIATPYTYQATAADPDGTKPTDPTGETLTYSVVKGPQGLTIDPASGLVTWTPTAQQIGTDSVTLQVDDGRGGTATQAYAIAVQQEKGNLPPVIISTPVTQFTLPPAGGSPVTYQYPVRAIDADNDPLTYSLTTGPTGMTIDPGSGLITWNGPAAPAGPAAGPAPTDGLTLTAAGAAAGFSLTDFANGFPTSGQLNGNGSPIGIAFPPGGGVLVSDFPGNVRLFPTDANGQQAGSFAPAHNYTGNNAMGLTIDNGHFYMTQESNGAIVEINADGTFKQTILTGLGHLLAPVSAPNGHLYVSTENGNTILDVDPIAKTATTFLSGVPRPDGLTLSADGSVLYVAATTAGGGGHVYGYDTATKALVFDSGDIGGIPLAVDGTALGVGTLAGNIFANTNDGRVIEINLTTKAMTLIASGGSRGDFVTVDPNDGTLLLTQAHEIVRLTPPAGGSFAQDFKVAVRVDDGRGAFDTQSYVIHATASQLGEIEGSVFNDLNGNGVWDGAEIVTGSGTGPSAAPTVHIDPFYANSYSVYDLGAVAGVPLPYGPVLLKQGDPNTLLIGGSANKQAGELYAVHVVRGTGGHIIGFDGTATPFAEGAWNDGNMIYGPGDVLLVARWPVNQLGEILPGSTKTNKIIDLAALGVADSDAAINLVPGGFAGAGRFKIACWPNGEWYDAALAPDGSGTFNITNVTEVTAAHLPRSPYGPEGFIYVAHGSPDFNQDSLVVSEWAIGAVSTYQVDGNGDPIISTRRTLLSNLPAGAEGAMIDPLTGDYLFGTFGGSPDHVFAVRGFNPTVAPEPGLGGWTVYLDQNHDGKLDPGDPSTTTDAQGHYAFTNLLPGNYTVAEVGQPGWRQTAPAGGAYTVTVQPGHAVSSVDFGNTQLNVTPHPPAFASTPPATGTVGQRYDYAPAVSNPDGQPVTFDLPLHPDGMVVDPTTGALAWVPTAAQVGSQQVIVRVRDVRGDSVLQPFAVQVAPAVAPTFITSSPPTEPAVVGLPFVYQVQAQTVPGNVLAFRLDTAPQGMAIDAKTGLLTWTPTANRVGSQPVVITVSDDHGGQSSQSFTLGVVAAAPNQAPTITSRPGDTAGMGSTYFYAVQASDPDGDPLTYSLVAAPTGMTINAAGLLVWRPGAGQFGANAVKLQVSDGRGGTAEQDFTVNVVMHAFSPLPVIVSRPPLGATVGQPYQYDGQAQDPDGNPLVWSLDVAPVGMSVDPSRGTLRWVPTAAEIGPQNVVVRVTDTQAGGATQTFTIQVRGVNLPPVITSTPPTQAAVGSSYGYAVKASDADNDPLSYSLTTAPAGMTIDAATGAIAWTPGATGVGPQNVALQVDDGQGGLATQTYQVVVAAQAPNQPPTITSVPEQQTTVGQLYQYQVTASDPDGDPLHYALGASPAGMTIDPATGLVQWTPGPAALTGPNEVTVRAIDPAGLAGEETYDLAVLPPNQPPQITSAPVTSLTAGLTYHYDVQASDPDGDPLTYTLTTGPAGMAVDSLGRLTWPTGTGDVGVHPVTITVADDQGAAVTQTYNLTVAADTQAPQVRVAISANPADLGSPVTFFVSATDDVAVQALSLTVGGTPLALDSTGRATMTPSQAGQFAVVATASGAAGNQGTATDTLTVINPHVTNAPDVSLTAPADGAVVTSPVDVTGTASDPNLLSYTLAVAPLGSNSFTQIASGTKSVVNGVLGKFDPSGLANDTYVLRLTATNTGGLISQVESQVNVAGNLKLGNFTLSFTDLTVPVAGIPITVTRTYDTLNADNQTDVGYGWRLAFRDVDLRASVAPSGQEDLGIYTPFRDGTRVYVTLPGGQRQGFTFQPQLNRLTQLLLETVGLEEDAWEYDPVFVPDAGVTSTLTLSGVTTMIRDSSTGEYYSIGGDQMTFNPADDAFGAVYTLTTKDGVAYEIDGPTSKLRRIVEPNGNTLTFTEAGISSSGGEQVTFERDAQGRVSAVVGPMGNKVHYHYSDRGDLVAVTDRGGNTTRFVYNPAGTHYLDQVIDPLGHTGVRANYDDQGRLVSITNGNGNAVQLSYDPIHSSETVLDRLGNPMTYVYDNQGDILSETNALGGTTTNTYDANNNLLTETDPLGHTTAYTYDASGNQLTQTDALGHVTQYGYTSIPLYGAAPGAPPAPIFLQTTTTDALGNTTSNSYDSSGNLLSVTDAAGHATSFVYGPSGSPTSITDTAGGKTAFQYGAAGHLSQQTDPLGNVTHYTYDADGNVLTQTSTLTTPTGVRTLVTTFTYDANGHRTSVTDAEGNVSRSLYDAAGNKVADIDPLGRKTKYVYDNLGELTQTTYPDGSSTKKVYDADGHLTATIDELGRQTTMKYDVLGRPTETDYPDGSSTKTAYDAAGEIIAQVDERGNRTQYTYDAAGRRLTVTDAQGNVTKTTYDAAGHAIAVTDPLGHVTRSVFDAMGRRVETDYADGSKAAVTYDAGGRVASRTDQAGVTTSYKYDALGRLTAVIDALGQATSYAYDEAGDLISQADASGHVTHYEYDGLGPRTAAVLPMGQRSTTTYDAAGETRSTTDFNGQTITYAYDARGRLVTEDFPDGTSTTFTYTADGQRATATDSRGVTSYTYDARDRLLSRINPDGTTISYTYDAAGNRTSVTTPAGTTSYTFTVLSQIATVTDPSKGVTQYTYDADGNLTHTTLPNGTSEVRQYDALNRLVYLENDGPSGVISSYRYTLDPDGNRTRVVEDTGRTTRYAYDALFRLIGETITDPAGGNRTIAYTYDAVGNRLARNESREGLTTDTYDADGRLLTETLGSQTTAYTYDKNGNTLSQVKSATDQVFYRWDAQNHMVGVDVTDAGRTHHTTYAYDADGIRASATTDGVETRYLIDTVQPNPEVLLEYRPNGAAVVSYVYGNDLIEQDRGGAQSYYQKDGLGSTRALTSANGAVTDRYVFDAFGRIIAQTGSTVNSYLFAGQQRDAATGFDYLRARYLNTGSGTFLSKDPAEPKLTSPLTANAYIYADDNPVRFVDPTGRQGDLVSLSVSISVEASLASFQINFAQAGLRGVARTAKVVDAILRPAFILEDVSMNLIADDQAQGLDVYQMGRTLEATGYRAIGAVLLRIYAETAQSQLPKVKVKINSIFFDFEAEFQAFEGQYKFKGGGVGKQGGYGDFDAELDALIEQVHTFVETTGVDANTTDMQFSQGIKQITDLAIKVIGKIPTD
jgi:RHS repeat-associated protein